MVQPSLQPPGGGNGVGAWMLEALREDYELSVLTWEPFAPQAIDRFYGTALAGAGITTHGVAAWLRRSLDAIPLPLSLLKTSLLLRRAKRMAAGFDVLLSANNEADFGRPGIQYIHFPWGYQPRPPVDLRWYHPRVLRSLYYRLCVAIAGFSFDSMRANVSLVNSAWTGGMMQRRHGVAGRTLHPPVPGDFPDVPWAAREPGFLCIGRIAPEKEVERVVEILAAVREVVPDVHLHIVGTPGPPAYCARIRRLAERHGGWISLNESLPRADLVRLIAGHRFGIHGMREEHFGIGIAEMVRAGCVVWVPDGGGQVEIVSDARLRYASVEDAAKKILRVLQDPAELAAVRADLAARRDLFSTERFAREIRAIAATLSADPTSKPPTPLNG